LAAKASRASSLLLLDLVLELLQLLLLLVEPFLAALEQLLEAILALRPSSVSLIARCRSTTAILLCAEPAWA